MKLIKVAVAILQRKNQAGQDEVLLASRPSGKAWAGWWEFPGGKIEANESPAAALSRELQEELGITPLQTQSWIIRHFDYPATHDSAAKTVQLHFYFVNSWADEILPKESQQLSWQNPQNISVAPLLPANAAIMKMLAWPTIYAISNVAEMGETAWLVQLENQLKNGLQMVQLREKLLTDIALERLARHVLQITQQYNAKLIINSKVDLALKVGAHGVHLTSQQLAMQQDKLGQFLAEKLIIAASCHHALDLRRAQDLGLDFVVLSPVNVTKSHDDAATLGWQQFEKLIENYPLPVYALGGMQISDLAKAQSCGGRGIAMQRAVWQ